MDDTTKLSPKLLWELLSALKESKKDPPADPDAFLRTHLTEEQARAAQQVLRDPQRLQTLLQHPQIRTLLQKLQTGTAADGTDGV